MSQEWIDLLSPLTSEELHYLHDDWGFKFNGRMAQDKLLKSLLNAVRNGRGGGDDDNEDDDDRPPTRAEIARVALRSAARLASSKEWRVYKLPGVPQKSACQERALGRTAREVLGDLFGEGDSRLFFGAMNDHLNMSRVWMYVWAEGAAEGLLMCAQAGSRALLAAAPPIEHEAAIVDSVSKALGLGEYGQPMPTKKRGSDIATFFRTAFRAESGGGGGSASAKAGQERAREQQAESKKRARIISGDFERDDGSVASVGPGGSLGGLMGEGEPVSRKKARLMAREKTWWRRDIPRKSTGMKVKCIVRTPVFRVVNVVVRGKNIKEGINQLAAEKSLVDVPNNVTQSVQLVSQ